MFAVKPYFIAFIQSDTHSSGQFGYLETKKALDAQLKLLRNYQKVGYVSLFHCIWKISDDQIVDY